MSRRSVHLVWSVLAIACPAWAQDAANAPPTVGAGEDQAVAVGQAVQLHGSVSDDGRPSGRGLRIFWSKVSGPGTARFGHEDFADSFETGDVSLWLAGGGGNHTGGGSASDERPRSGRFSWKAHNGDHAPAGQKIDAKLLRWRFDYRQAYYSAWYYWPEDYVVNGREGSYVNIFQYKERSDPWDPTYIVAVKDSIARRGEDDLVVHDWHGQRIIRNDVAVPKGRWFHVQAYMKVGRSDGELTVWLDGRRVFDLQGINTLGNESNTSPPFCMWGVGNYGGAGANRFLYVDDCSVTNADKDVRNTTVTFDAPGTYVLRLTADDGDQTVSDEVTITVR